MIDTERYIGKNAKEVMNELTLMGHSVRIIPEFGIITADFNPYRYNLHCGKDNVIVMIDMG